MYTSHFITFNIAINSMYAQLTQVIKVTMISKMSDTRTPKHSTYEMIVDEMVVDEMLADEMVVDERILDEMVVDEILAS
jgi:hypothetical protein